MMTLPALLLLLQLPPLLWLQPRQHQSHHYGQQQQ
jgi:hypothetical protein